MPHSRRVRSVLLAASFAMALLPCVASLHEAAAAEIVDVQVGLGGDYKLGYWTPLRVTIAGESVPLHGQLVITTPDGDGVATEFADSELIEVPAGATVEVVGYAKIGRQVGGSFVEFRASGKTVARRDWGVGFSSPAMQSDQEWIVTLGPDFGVQEALRGVRLTSITDLQTLPDEWYGYEGVDTIVVATSDVEPLLKLSDQQRTSLHEWVTLGGRVLFCAGANGEQVFSPTSPLAEFAPGDFARVTTLRSLSSLETFVHSSQAIDSIDVPGGNSEMRVSLLTNVKGRLDVFEPSSEGKRPIIARAAHGLGQVVFVAFDLDQPPFSLWDDRGRAIEKILRGDVQTNERTRRRQETGQLVHLGYNDMVGQLRNALDQFSRVSLVAFSWIAGLIVVYILLIGPADYFVLKNVFKKMQLTWITFTSATVAFSIIAVLLHAQVKVRKTQVNQLDLVDVDTTSGVIRGTTWAHVYSPRTAAYDVELEPTLWTSDEGGSLLTWQGLPGKGLGGLRAKRVGISDSAFSDSAYSITRGNGHSSITGVPLHTDGTRVLSARWWRHQPFASASELHTNVDGLLRGEITNPLPFALSDCVLMYDIWAYRLERKGGTLRPSDSADIRFEKPLNLSWRLTRRRVVDIRDNTTPWDPQALDVSRILELMMFFKSAGGEDYTRLTHRYQSYLDLSEHLRLGRAVLLGRVDESATKLIVDGADAGDKYDERSTFCRIVFPVDRSAMTRTR